MLVSTVIFPQISLISADKIWLISETIIVGRQVCGMLFFKYRLYGRIPLCVTWCP